MNPQSNASGKVAEAVLLSSRPRRRLADYSVHQTVRPGQWQARAGKFRRAAAAFVRLPGRAVAWAVAVSFGLAVLPALGAPALDGRAIYQAHCVKCHGAQGEGVKGEYEDALIGDWSLARLTRTIERTMPEDDPKKVTGKDADAVARYIHDAFYSREARARKQSARVELVRLTNRQFQNAVADLFRHFTGTGEAVGRERGLRAGYFNSRSTRGDKKVFDRIDPQVHFDFGEGSPDTERIKPEEFSMAWSGSVIADETGDYEFILKTPNGARLWVNDTDKALIDAWVASGTLTEHRATLRLIGGRAYPLRLDYFKYKEKTASVSLEWVPPHGVQQPIPARHLAPARSASSFVVTTPFPADDSSVGYERGVAVSKGWDEAVTQAAIEAANHTLRNLDSLARTRAEDQDRRAKIEAFCREFVQTAFRRPLTDEQARLFVGAQFKSAGSVEDAAKRVVLLTLKSPRFLYLGLGNSKADDFETASRLSFGLWDSLPDRELFKAAAEGRLRTPEQVAAQARRMLGDSRARAKAMDFLHVWLQMHYIEDLAKDPKLFPGFTPEVIADLRASLNLFLEDAVWNTGSDYRELLLADYLYLNERLAKFYGVEGGRGDDFAKVHLDASHRSGVLTHPFLLAAFSYPKSTSPIHRGVFLTRNIVGRALKPPPMAVEFKESDFSPNMTMREKVAKLTRTTACQSCHSVINPLGFSLENFDAVGRFRTMEGKRNVDTVSDFPTDDGGKVRLAGARDVAEFAVGSEQAQNSFIEQLWHQVVKQPMLAYGPGVSDRLRTAFVKSHFNVKELLIEIATVAALHGKES